jgi:hypothetical protein
MRAFTDVSDRGGVAARPAARWCNTGAITPCLPVNIRNADFKRLPERMHCTLDMTKPSRCLSLKSVAMTMIADKQYRTLGNYLTAELDV